MTAFFATCAKGTELALKDELRELRMYRVRADRGGVRFEGDAEHAMRACLHSRIAIRVLEPIGTFPAANEDALYAGVRAIEWERWLTSRQTLAVSAVSKQSVLNHTAYLAQKTKDAIVDRLRDLHGERPSVDRDDPDLAVFVHLVRDQATVHLDWSGESLHRRGWRTDAGEAPLKETLAAAILRLAGWDRRAPLVDPVCGSGTLPIEADLWARNVPPNLGRERFGFERWADHDDAARAVVRDVRAAARASIVHDGAIVHGSDSDPRAIAVAEANARRAGAHVRFRTARLRDLAPPPGALVVGNPPYGVRLEEGALWDDVGRALPRLTGHTLALLLESPPPRGLMPPPERDHELWNGKLECRLRVWRLP